MDLSAKIYALAMTATDLEPPWTLKKAVLFLMTCIPGAAAVALGYVALLHGLPI
jgi:hypothetical protein